MTTYSSPDGHTIDLENDTVSDLLALSHITRESTAALAKQAIEQLRNTLVPSTRAVVARAVRKQKGATA